MGLFNNKMSEPVFLKQSSDAQEQLEALKKLTLNLNTEGQAILNQDIRNLEYGIQGENNLFFELKNSHIPMYVLRDIYLEEGELSAQIDYIVITRKICFIIECKNLYGNIEITSNGDFIRTMEYNGKKRKEGIYSPVTQNIRHLELIRKIRRENKRNFFTKLMGDRVFNDFYQSIIVLANPKTILHARFAKKEIKEQVIRADQLAAYIKAQCAKSREMSSSDEGMKAWAEFFLQRHKKIDRDYTSKYGQYIIRDKTAEDKDQAVTADQPAHSAKLGNKNNRSRSGENEDKAEHGPEPVQLLCSKCGGKMQLRIARKGPNAGKRFYGCSNFPKCRMVINIDEG